MKISKNDQRYLLYSLRRLMEDVREDVETTQSLLNDGVWKPEVRDLLEQDLKDGFERAEEVQDLTDRVRSEIIE